jgi:hypothetical protein
MTADSFWYVGLLTVLGPFKFASCTSIGSEAMTNDGKSCDVTKQPQ